MRTPTGKTSGMRSDITPLFVDKEQPDFIVTPQVQNIVDRIISYLDAGFPVHLCGPAGTGKTTIAFYVCGQIERPVMLIHGDEEFSTSDLVGGTRGYRRKYERDNFIHSVLKMSDQAMLEWVDSRVTVACKNGYTLLYDEFTRSRPEANNVLLPVLEERMLDLPAARGDEGHLRVAPEFRAIFTSNPAEYAGIHPAQDALLDRMITIDLHRYDRQTQAAIAAAKGGVSPEIAWQIVNLVRASREAGLGVDVPTVRSAIMLAKLVGRNGMQVKASDDGFSQACLDVLAGRDDEDAPARMKAVLAQAEAG